MFPRFLRHRAGVHATVVVLAGAARLEACDLCAAYSAHQVRGEFSAGAFAGVAEQFTHLGTLQEAGTKVNNPTGQYLDSSISQLFLGYNLSDRIGLQFNAPIFYRAFKRPDEMGGVDHGRVTGLGDISLLANWVPYRQVSKSLTVTWTLLGGVKFPTGSTDYLQEELNEPDNPVGPPNAIHGHDLTLGSGSYDGIVGSALYLNWHRVFLTTSVQYAIRSEGAYSYRFANDLLWAAGPGYYLELGQNDTLGLQVVVSGESKGNDTFQGASTDDTGITSVYVGPQFSLTVSSKLSAQLGLDLPLLRNNTGLQVVPDYRVRAGLTWYF